MLLQGDFIWIEPVGSKSDFVCPIGARVLEADQGRIRVKDDDGQVCFLKAVGTCNSEFTLVAETSVFCIYGGCRKLPQIILKRR